MILVRLRETDSSDSLLIESVTFEAQELVGWREGSEVIRYHLNDVAELVPYAGSDEWQRDRQTAHPRAGQPWTAEEDGELRGLFNDGVDVAGLSAQLGRSTGAIQSRLERLGLVKYSPTYAASDDPDVGE